MDRKSKDLTEEEIKKRWQENTELYLKRSYRITMMVWSLT